MKYHLSVSPLFIVVFSHCPLWLLSSSFLSLVSCSPSFRLEVSFLLSIVFLCLYSFNSFHDFSSICHKILDFSPQMPDSDSFASSALGATKSQDRPPCYWDHPSPLSSCFLFPGSPLYLLRCWLFFFLFLKLLLHPSHTAWVLGFQFSDLDAVLLSLPIFPLSNFLAYYYVCLLWN